MPRPDLQPLARDTAPAAADPAVGDVFDVDVTVRNVGERAAEAFTVGIFDGDPARGGSLLHSEFVDRLLVGDDLVITIPYELTDGFHELHVLADPDGFIDETDETNNHARLLLRTRADVVPSIVSVDPAAPLANDMVRVASAVANEGCARLGRVDVHVFAARPATAGV